MKCIQQLTHHTDDIESIVVTKNGRYLFAGSSDSTVSVWDLKKFINVATLSGHKGAVFSLELFNEDKQLLTGSRDHWIKVYNTSTFELVTTLHPPHYDVVQCLATSGSLLISGSRDYSLKKWDLSPIQGSQINTPDFRIPLLQTNNAAHRDWIKAISFVHFPPRLLASSRAEEDSEDLESKAESISNEVFATGSRDGQLKWWKLNTMEKVGEQKLHDASLNHLLCSDDKLLTASSDRTIRLWSYK